MPERIPKSVAKLVVFRAVLASDGKTAATGKTIPITISKNGAASFSNPAAGATNATEMASGFYKFTLAAGDNDTVGPLTWKGAEGTIVDVGDVFEVVGDVTIAGQLIIQDGIDVSCTTSNRPAIKAVANGTGTALRLHGGSGGGAAVFLYTSSALSSDIVLMTADGASTNGIRCEVGGTALKFQGGTLAAWLVSGSNAATEVVRVESGGSGDTNGITLTPSGTAAGINTTAEEALLNSIADTILRRLMANVEASTDGDTLGEASLYGLVQRVSKSSTLAHANKLTIYKTDGTTELAQVSTASDASADPITKMGV